MIARTWTARATAEGAIAYFEKVRENELPHFQSVPGYRGCRFMTREAPGSGGGSGGGDASGGGGAVEILVVTFWESMEAVKAFVGDDPTRAHLPPDIMATLDRYDEEVTHYDVVIDESVPS